MGVHARLRTTREYKKRYDGQKLNLRVIADARGVWKSYSASIENLRSYMEIFRDEYGLSCVFLATDSAEAVDEAQKDDSFQWIVPHRVC